MVFMTQFRPIQDHHFQKDFDSVSHELLIHQLKSYNMSESMITSLSSILNDRKQSVRINGSTSF